MSLPARRPLVAVLALASVALLSIAAARGDSTDSLQAPGPRVLLLYDMEGITGAVRASDVNFGSPTYQATRESLVEDVNAAIRGLQKAGASEVVVLDGHGSGSPDPDYLLDRMPTGARHEVAPNPSIPTSTSWIAASTRSSRSRCTARPDREGSSPTRTMATRAGS